MNYSSDENLPQLIKSIPGPILIIGASGFIGSHLYLELKKYRSDIFGTSTCHRNWRTLSLNLSLDILDIQNLESLKSLFFRIRPRTIFNLASFGNYHWQQDSQKIFNVNIIGTLNVLEASKALSNAQLIQVGSSSEYGTNVDFAAEDHLPAANSLYGISKYTSSELVKYFAEHYAMKCVHLRLFSVYGALEAPDRFIVKVVASHETKVLPKISSQKTSRDFVYIDDVISLIARASTSKKEEIWGKSFNICTGKSYTLEEVAQIAKELWVIQEEVQVSQDQSRNWDVKDWRGNPALTEQTFGFRCETPLRVGLERTLNQYKKLATFRPRSENTNQIISLIIASYNDEQNLPELYNRINEQFALIDYDYELIIVNDGSMDSTSEIIKDISQKDARVLGVVHTRAFGSQNAFLNGLNYTKGAAVVMMDGDLQDPPEVISKMIKKWEEGAEVVGALRKTRSENSLLTTCRQVFYTLLKFFASAPIDKDVGDFALVDKKVATQMQEHGKRGVFFLRTLRSFYGFSYSEVEYHRPERFSGKSTNSLWKNSWWALFGFFSVANKMSFLASVSLMFSILFFLIFNSNFFLLISIAFGLFVVINNLYLHLFQQSGLPKFVLKELIYHGKSNSSKTNEKT